MFGFSGTVYILENSEAHRVKVGATINTPEERLLDINRMWLGVKGRCQICLSWRLLEPDGRMPKHTLSNHCPGSYQLPFARGIELAEQKLKDLQGQIQGLRGGKKISAITRIKNLEKLVEAYRDTPKQVGSWQIRAAYRNGNAYGVELIAHEILANHLDTAAPFGEVFSCPPQEAILAVESAITQLDMKLENI